MANTLAEVIAGEVRAEMARQNVSGRQMAAVLNMSQFAMAARLRGDVELRPNELEKIAERLGQPVEWFLHDRTGSGRDLADAARKILGA